MNPSHFERRIPLILELGFREAALPGLRQYVDLLWNSNQELNLFSRLMKFEELIDNHVVDCLLPLRYFPPGLRKAADFGSGGGLPGVLYALQFPETQLLLFEKSKLKQAFLKKAQVFAPNLVIQSEIPTKLPTVELVTARAFKPLDVILSMSREFYLRGGSYFLLKGRLEKVTEEIAIAQKSWKDLRPRVEKLHSPLMDVERHLILLGPVSK